MSDKVGGSTASPVDGAGGAPSFRQSLRRLFWCCVLAMTLHTTAALIGFHYITERSHSRAMQRQGRDAMHTVEMILLHRLLDDLHTQKAVVQELTERIQ